MKFSWFIPALIWFIISAVLLSLPGDDLPKSPLFEFPYFDKLVHLGMFFLLSSLFCYPLSLVAEKSAVLKSQSISISLCILAYGIIMEFVQKYFVVGRSFDVVDIVFDGIGSFTGMLAVIIYYGKKIGLDRNRGRNQN